MASPRQLGAGGNASNLLLFPEHAEGQSMSASLIGRHIDAVYSPATLLIEESPVSHGLIQSLREQSINVTAYKPETDKRARLIAQSDLFAGGSVRFPRKAAWLEDFTAELLAFPGRHDDQVDALAQGLAWRRNRQGEVSCGFVRGFF